MKPQFSKHKKKVFQLGALVSNMVYQIGETADLRKPTKEVSLKLIKTPEFQSKIKLLKSSLKKYKKLTGHGRGIAAPQIGINESFFVVWMPPKSLRGDKVDEQVRAFGTEAISVFINPKVTKSSKEKYRYSEMCMSAYPIIAPVVRPAWIEFEYLNETGERKVWDTKDDSKVGMMLNRVFQHEIDHLKGIINIDLVPSKELILESDPKFYAKTKFEKV